MRPFDKTATTLVRPHPFSTLCSTPLGKMTLWRLPESPGIIDSDKAFAYHAQCATSMNENARSLYLRMPLVPVVCLRLA